MLQNRLKREYIAELVGTFILVFFGTAAVVITKLVTGAAAFGVIQHLVIGIAFGAALIVAATTVGPISGAHLNPAVTIGLALEKRISKDQVIPYIVAQCAGAILASLVLQFLLGTKGYGLGETRVGPLGMREALGAEAILTAFLVFTVLGATDKGAPAGFAGLVIGGYLAASHLIGIPLSGNSLNPARSLGPAILVGGDALRELFPVYVVAPIVGAIAGAWKYRWLKRGG